MRAVGAMSVITNATTTPSTQNRLNKVLHRGLRGDPIYQTREDRAIEALQHLAPHRNHRRGRRPGVDGESRMVFNSVACK